MKFLIKYFSVLLLILVTIIISCNRSEIGKYRIYKGKIDGYQTMIREDFEDNRYVLTFVDISYGNAAMLNEHILRGQYDKNGVLKEIFCGGWWSNDSDNINGNFYFRENKWEWEGLIDKDINPSEEKISELVYLLDIAIKEIFNEEHFSYSKRR